MCKVINCMIKILNFLDEIKISQGSGVVEAQSIWGILRGLESFSQLIYAAPDGRSVIFLH